MAKSWRRKVSRGKSLENLLESRDEYTAENVFWVPTEARWAQIQSRGKTPNIGKLIDDAMYAIEKDNPKLRGKLPRDYARRGISPERLGGLIDQIASIAVGTKEAAEERHSRPCLRILPGQVRCC